MCVCVCMCMQALVSCGKIILQDTPLSLSLYTYTLVHRILSVGVLIDTPLSLSLSLYTPTQ